MGIRALLIPPYFFERPTLAVDTFIDIVGQNWPRNAGLCTPLQQTVIQRGPPPRWPQLSKIAWFSEKSYTYHLIKRRFPATLFVTSYTIFMVLGTPTRRSISYRFRGSPSLITLHSLPISNYASASYVLEKYRKLSLSEHSLLFDRSIPLELPLTVPIARS